MPYARVYFIDGTDTVKLTCDALGNFYWYAPRKPHKFKIRAMATGFKTYEREYNDYKLDYANYIGMSLKPDVKDERELEELNKVILFPDKVQLVLRGDTVEHKMEVLKMIKEGDFVGSLLRKLPGVSTANDVLTVNGVSIHSVEFNNPKYVYKGKTIYYSKQILLDDVKRVNKLQKEQRKDE